MDLSVAKSRIASVIKPDSITASQGDFLATHVPLKRLYLLNKYEFQPVKSQYYNEEEIYSKYIINPENRHQFITVYGQSGTGKSHLIRWFEARFENDKPENEVVLFIRRSDNTLKGTIRQLLDKPEVQGIRNKEIYDRLVRAAVSVEPSKLKDLIYYNFIIEVANDDGETHAIHLNNVTRKRLEAFLSNDIVRAHLMESSGPIERLYSKVAENTLVDRDTIAEFTAEDFLVTPDLCDAIINAGGDRKAEGMARRLMADDDGLDTAREISEYLNQFVNDVIQRCAGIEPGDFRQIFQDIRSELKRLDKNLTLFIEDVTSFTGVDDALLDALIVEHTGLNSGTEMCRISSIVGTTSNYLQNNFRDNHKDRITNLIYIPSDAFDENGIYEFVGRYLNTMSLPEQRIKTWLNNRALPSEYPIHSVKEGAGWDYVEVDSQTHLNLYPFSKSAIMYLYKNNLTKGHQTPRYMIRDIIEPVMNDIINNRQIFPTDFCQLVGFSSALSFQIQNQVRDTNLAARMLRFLTIWGNGTTDRTKEGEDTYFAGIKESIISEMGFPILSGTVIEVKSEKKTVSKEPAVSTNSSSSVDKISQETQSKVASAREVLTRWINGDAIDVSATGGIIGILRNALISLNEYVKSSINWLSEGVSPDDISKALVGSRRILGLERQSKGSGYYILPANTESMNLIEVMIRWREFGKQSWNYADSDFDLYFLTLWSAKTKDEIVEAVRENTNKQTPYIEAAIVGNVYQQILLGEYGGKSIDELTIDNLFLFSGKSVKNSAHSSKWISLCNMLTQKNADADNRNTVRKYFNLPQGDGGTKIVLNVPDFSRLLNKIKKNRLAIPSEDLNSNDISIQRQYPYRFLKDILERLDSVVEAEIELAKPLIEKIKNAFLLDDELLDEDMLDDLSDNITRFYNEANNNKIGIHFNSANDIKNNAKKIVKAYKQICDVLDSKDNLSVLMAFSDDPISSLRILTVLLDKLNEGLENANAIIANRLSQLNLQSSTENVKSPYVNALEEIRSVKSLWKGTD